MAIDHAVDKWYRVVTGQVLDISSGGKYHVTTNSLSLRNFQSGDQGSLLG